MKQTIKRKMKQVFAGILILLLFSQSTLCVYASNRNISPKLYNYSYLSDTLMYVEFKTNQSSWNLSLTEGDYAIISPIHGVDTNYLSYDLQDAESSDSSVVSVSYQKKEDGKLGLKLHACKEGSAEVSVTFNTYTTRMGLNYQDMRGNSTFTKTIYVEVERKGSVDVELNVSGGKYASVKGVTLSMVTMKDTLSSAQKQEIQKYVGEATADYAWEVSGMGALSSAVTDATGIDAKLWATDQEAAVDKVYEVNGKKVLEGIGEVTKDYTSAAGNAVISGTAKAGNAVTGLIGKIFGLLDDTLTTAERINRAYVYAKYASMKVPVFAPQNLTLTVSVTNNTPHTIENVTVDLEKDSHLSSSSITGPWGGSQCILSGVSIEPGETEIVDLQIYPQFVYGTLSTAGEKVKAYTASVEANVSYTQDSKKKSVSEKIDLDAYTTITQEKLSAYRKTLIQEYKAENVDAFTSALMGGAFNGYKRWYGYSCFSQVFIFACPVETVIRNQNGEELTVLSEDGDAYTGEEITAFVVDDVKYVIVEEGAEDNYQISARATDEGDMDVLTYQYDDETGVSVKAYDSIPLETGASFEVQTSANAAADLGSTDDSGNITVLTSDYQLDQETLIAELMSLGLSEEEAEACVKLMVRGVISEEMIENLSGEMDQEGFCELLLNTAEDYFGISLTTEEEGEMSAVQRAQSAGLLTGEQDPEAVFGVEDALVLTDRLLEMMGVETESQTAEEKARAKGWQIEESEETDSENGPTTVYYLNRGIAENGSLSVKSAVLLASRILEHAETAAQCSNLISRICEAYTNSMSWNDFYSAGIYGMDQDTEKELLLENFAFWMPQVSSVATLLSSHIDNISSGIQLYDAVNTRNGEALVAEQGYEAFCCPELAGIFTDENGSIYRWVPFCYLDEQGEIYQDAVYLYITEMKEGVAKDYIDKHGLAWSGEDATVNMFVIADQEIVTAFLETALPNAVFDIIDESMYEELSEGSSGDAVVSLQKGLIWCGYLDGTADGSFGAGTAAAVSAYQKAHGLEETGAADPYMQASLYAEKAKAFYNWVQEHADDTVYELAMQNLTQREAEPVYELPANVMADDPN